MRFNSSYGALSDVLNALEQTSHQGLYKQSTNINLSSGATEPNAVVSEENGTILISDQLHAAPRAEDIRANRPALMTAPFRFSCRTGNGGRG
jgi:hypothetical protein